MERLWAAEQLSLFAAKIDELYVMHTRARKKRFGPDEWLPEQKPLLDELLAMEPAMRLLMNAAQPGLGDYDNDRGFYLAWSWIHKIKPLVLRAIGIHTLAAEARTRMQPDSPFLAGDSLHFWVWGAAKPLWDAGNRQEALHAATRSINARLQQKLNRHDVSETALCREAFSRDPPKPGRPRLRFPGDRSSPTWNTRQQGAADFGAGCFEAIRNPAAHQQDLNLPEYMAIEQLAALSLLARWIEECSVESIKSSED